MTEKERAQIVALIAQRFWAWPEYSRRTAMRDVADGLDVQHGAHRERVHVPADQVGYIVREAWERSLGGGAMRTQHAGKHPSDRLLNGPCAGFEEALELVEDEHAYERGLLVDAGAVPEVVQRRDGADAPVFAAVAHARRLWLEEQEAARLRTLDRLRADALAAEAALDDEAARWLGLLAEALEAGDYSGLAL